MPLSREDRINQAIKQVRLLIEKEEGVIKSDFIEEEKRIGVLNSINTILRDYISIKGRAVRKQDKKMMPIELARKVPTMNSLVNAKQPVFLMCYPLNVSNKEPNNIWMKDKENVPPFDINKALSQWMDLYKTISTSALVYIIPTVEELQDQVYVANLGIALPLTVKSNIFILSNFRSEPRRHEEDVGRDFMAENEYNVIQCKYFFEGEADLKFVKDNIFVGGWGIRTAPEAYDWMMNEFDMKIIKVKMTDPRQYHFDCLFFPINNENALVCTELIDPKNLKQIEDVTNVIPVTKSHAYGGTTSSVRSGNIVLNCSDISSMDIKNPNYALESERVNWFTKTMANAGVEPILVNLSEFNKSGAALSCMLMHMNYVDYLKVI